MYNMEMMAGMAVHATHIIFQNGLVPRSAYINYGFGNNWFRLYIYCGRDRRQVTFKLNTKSTVPAEEQVLDWIKKRFN